MILPAVRTITLTLATATVIGLAGCAPKPQEDTLNVEEAKALAQAGELEIIGYIPAKLIVSVDQQATGSLLSCEGDRNYTWAGGTIVTLSPGTNVTDVIDGLYKVYADRTGWKAEREESAHGDPQVLIDGPEQDGYLAGGIAERSTIDLDSYSPCFHLPEGQSSRGSF